MTSPQKSVTPVRLAEPLTLAVTYANLEVLVARRPFAVLSALVPLSLLVLTAAPSGAVETTTPRPDAAVQVTADPTAVRGHATPSMAVHPDDAHVLALAEGDA